MDVEQKSRFTVTRSSQAVAADQRAILLADPGFGRLFTDHMVTIRYTEGQGWHSHSVGPREAFQLDPACAVLHYAQEIFEGMKAYRLADGSVAMFRPEENARRFAESAERMAMPALPEALFLEAVEELVKIDADWIPQGEGSLYLRPFMFASETFLGVRPSHEVDYYVIASPAAAYFKGGVDPVSIWLSSHYKRAAPGGTGYAKCGGNYAASLAAQKEAEARGERVTALYHSHVDADAYLSAEDLTYAESPLFPFPGALQIVLSVMGDRVKDTVLFEMDPELGLFSPGCGRLLQAQEA